MPLIHVYLLKSNLISNYNINDILYITQNIFTTLTYIYYITLKISIFTEIGIVHLKHNYIVSNSIFNYKIVLCSIIYQDNIL